MSEVAKKSFPARRPSGEKVVVGDLTTERGDRP